MYIHDTIVRYANKSRRAIAVNGQIPMPTLYFTEGDTAEIYAHNELNEETSLHFHGLILPNKEDGVPYLTQLPIKPHTAHVYTFPIIQHGTHWYHSHSGLQEQIGMYGNFVMNKKPDDTTFTLGIDDIPAIPIILSEWTNYKPENIHRMLHNASDWFAIKKNATQSYAEAIQQGYIGTKLKNEWKRMLAMDVSDVYYDKILINGQNKTYITKINDRPIQAGDKIRLRISNGGASSYFWITFSGGKFRIVASDGNDIQPTEVDRLIVAVSETYDIIVSIKDSNTIYELLATAEDRTQSASYYIGNGSLKASASLSKLNYFEGMKMMNDMMRMNGRLDDMGMKMSLNQMDMNVVMYPEITGSRKSKQSNQYPNRYDANAIGPIVTMNYAMMKATLNTRLPDSSRLREFKLELSGNMNRYVWSIDDRVVSESEKIIIKKNEKVRLIIYNGSMMRHPMHLHGHDFRLINGTGDYAPLKNIIDIMPMETDTLEFLANHEGDWFFHCHILYHMMSGMGRVFTYQDQAANPLIPDPRFAWKKLGNEDRRFHFMAANDFATNGNDGMAMLQNTRWSIATEWRLGFQNVHGYEIETHIGRYIGRMQWWMPFVGYDWRYRAHGEHHEKNWFGQINTKNNRALFSAGFDYTLPMLVKFQTEVFIDGNVRLQVYREDIPLSKRLRAAFMYNTDKEYMVGFNYITGKNLGISAHYDSDMGWGTGLMVRY